MRPLRTTGWEGRGAVQRVGKRLFHISFPLMGGGGEYYLREAINLRTAIAGENTVLHDLMAENGS